MSLSMVASGNAKLNKRTKLELYSAIKYVVQSGDPIYVSPGNAGFPIGFVSDGCVPLLLKPVELYESPLIDVNYKTSN